MTELSQRPLDRQLLDLVLLTAHAELSIQFHQPWATTMTVPVLPVTILKRMLLFLVTLQALLLGLFWELGFNLEGVLSKRDLVLLEVEGRYPDLKSSSSGSK